jgi:hypothetical protein
MERVLFDNIVFIPYICSFWSVTTIRFGKQASWYLVVSEFSSTFIKLPYLELLCF